MKRELEKILSQLISFYPATSNQTNVKELLLFASSHFKSAGLTDCKILENEEINMLVTSTQHTKHPKVLLQAHVDVVTARKELQKKYVTSDGRLNGRGARDMLFATAGYLWLVDDLRKELSKLDIGIMLTGDEEVGGGSTMPFLIQQGYGADVVWLPDAGNNLQELVVRAKGVYNFTLTIYGQPHHGSRPWEGDNAALKLVFALQELTSYFEKNTREESSCSITKLDAGDSVNKGPGVAHAHIDIRFDTSESLSDIKKNLKHICNKYSGEISNLAFAESYFNDPSSKFIQEYININKSITGKDVQAISTSGSSDARYFSAKNIPVIMTRPKSGGSHSDNEWVDLDSLVEYCVVMREYVQKTAKI